LAKKATKKAAKKATPKSAATKLPFNIDHAAKEAGISAAHLRLKLRTAKVKKPGKAYGWDSKAAMIKDIGSVKAA